MMSSISRMILFLCGCLFAISCGSSTSSDHEGQAVLRIGANIEATGSYSYAGEASINAMNLFIKELNSSGRLQMEETAYQIEVILKDNESTIAGTEAAADELINDNDVLLIIGPNVSGLAIPAGEISDELKTLMISPWSSSPLTTQNRSWVYRSSFVDTDQSPILVNFATDHLHAKNACILYDGEPNSFPSGFAATFKADWEKKHGMGSVTAYESYETDSQDVSTQLSAISNSDCDFLLIPEYALEIPGIVSQIHDAGITVPVVGPDSWVDGNLVEECGADCNGYYFSKHFVASSEIGDAEAFVDRYTAEYGTPPGDVSALTWDAMLLAEQAIKNCGKFTGDLPADRACIRQGMRNISNLQGVTGNYTFNNSNNPEKCIPVVQIRDGELIFVETFCKDR